MKRSVFFQALMFMVAFSMFLCACSKREDVVNGITPVRQLSVEHKKVLDDLRSVKPEERADFIKKNWPNLSNDIVSWLASGGFIKKEEQVEKIGYYYGSAQKVKGADRSAQIHNGYFNNELVAEVWMKKKEDPSQAREHPIRVAVRCLNGLFEIKGNLTSLFSEVPNPVFTISKGKGLCDYVSYETAIDLAERFNLPLYKGKRMNKKFLIAPSAARELSNKTAEIQVTVRVYTGDRFDLINMTYNPASQLGQGVSEKRKRTTKKSA